MQNLNFSLRSFPDLVALFLFLLRLGRKLTSLERALQRLRETRPALNTRV